MIDPQKSAFTVAIVNTKGGVGKTTLAANIGAICADLGQRVLLVDCDPQGSLSNYFPVIKPALRGLSYVLQGRNIDGTCISQTNIHGLSIILHDSGMPAALIELSAAWQSEFVLDRSISALSDSDIFDIVIVDTPGASGLLQDLGIVPADLLLAPIIPETLSTSQVEPLLKLLKRYEQGSPNSRQAAVPCKAIVSQASITSNARTLTAELRSTFLASRGRFTLCQTIIPRVAVYDKAARQQTVVHRIEPSKGGVLGPASTSLHALVAELFPHLYDRVHATDEQLGEHV